MAGMDPAGLPALEDAIRHMHGAEPTYLESVPVRETFGEQVVWEGEVQVFALADGGPAPRCYAWSHATTGAKRRFYAVLHVPPIDSATAAVRAAIVADSRKM